jgi:peptidoglycan/LPS O-acetylase OafA/YrhL
MSSPMRRNLPALTISRFFAAALVVIFHYPNKLAIFPASISNFGYEAVTFFFILSGFILTYNHATSAGLNLPLGAFLRARLARIVPAYWLALLIAAPFTLAGVLRSGVDFDLGLVPLMLQSWKPHASLLWNPPAWSLSNEMFFYAIYPITWTIWLRLEWKKSIAISWALIVLADVARWLLVSDSDLAAYFPLLNLPQFLLGISLCQLYFKLGLQFFDFMRRIWHYDLFDGGS